MRPVHQAAKIIPLVHATYVYTIAHAERDALGQIDIVRYEHGSPVADIDNEPLVPGTIVMVRQQAPHEACDLYPAAVIDLLEGLVHAVILACSDGYHRYFNAAILLTT